MAESDRGEAAGSPRLLVRGEFESPERSSRGALKVRDVFPGGMAGFESSLVAVLRNHIPAGGMNEIHVHADIEKVYYVLQGVAEIECGPWARTARAGEFIFFPAAIPHMIRAAGSEDLEFIVVQAKVLGEPRGLGGA